MGRAFHHAMTELGSRDLHPGGEDATRLLLSWLPRPPAKVLEVGAGAGATARRLAGAGYDVTALEPDPVLFRRLAAVPGVFARNEPLEAGAGLHDAVLAESVLYALPLDRAFRKVRGLLRDGGVLCFVDMVWTPSADPAAVPRLHDATRDAFGLAVASREPLAWSDWRAALASAGFRVREERRLGAGSPGVQSRSRGRAVLGALRHPSLVADLLRFRRASRRLRVPPGWVESWACCASAV